MHLYLFSLVISRVFVFAVFEGSECKRVKTEPLSPQQMRVEDDFSLYEVKSKGQGAGRLNGIILFNFLPLNTKL